MIALDLTARGGGCAIAAVGTMHTMRPIDSGVGRPAAYKKGRPSFRHLDSQPHAHVIAAPWSCFVRFFIGPGILTKGIERADLSIP
jgi:hypothetical protein